MVLGHGGRLIVVVVCVSDEAGAVEEGGGLDDLAQKDMHEGAHQHDGDGAEAGVVEAREGDPQRREEDGVGQRMREAGHQEVDRRGEEDPAPILHGGEQGGPWAERGERIECTMCGERTGTSKPRINLLGCLVLERSHAYASTGHTFGWPDVCNLALQSNPQSTG